VRHVLNLRGIIESREHTSSSGIKSLLHQLIARILDLMKTLFTLSLKDVVFASYFHFPLL